jgi:hypothetical protein
MCTVWRWNQRSIISALKGGERSVSQSRRLYHVSGGWVSPRGGVYTVAVNSCVIKDSNRSRRPPANLLSNRELGIMTHVLPLTWPPCWVPWRQPSYSSSKELWWKIVLISKSFSCIYSWGSSVSIVSYYRLNDRGLIAGRGRFFL